MKVLLVNGSPHIEGNTHCALQAVAERLITHGIDSEILWIGNKPVRGCIACYACYELGRCVFHDDLYDTMRDKLAECDGLIVGSPTYYAGPNGSLCALLDRVFYSCAPLLRGKPGAAVAVARRGGASSTFERLNKYFQIMGMPMATANYWNIVYGREPGDAKFDAEGMQTMQTLADSMAWLLKAREQNPLPQFPPKVATNVIRPDLKS